MNSYITTQLLASTCKVVTAVAVTILQVVVVAMAVVMIPQTWVVTVFRAMVVLIQILILTPQVCLVLVLTPQFRFCLQAAVQSLVDKKTALIQAGTGAVVSTVGALATTGALPVMIKGTKKAVNKTVQTVNSTYHHTKEKVHNVTTHIFHPFRNKQEEKKTDMDGHKDEVSRRDLIEVMARSFKYPPKTFYLQSSSSVDVDEQDSDFGKS
ncbi:hypothetical protein C8R41DRAFT_808071 [Lentinula lateritia]|uniref:Transmembrane protein n=1 Tax=Lentinula lateritia TaxID=40482 RepID=A0ABQ8VXI3_9AGAR|nr:hypothetical protein C8R41DRAFT_808071 [Lentinula lateritia]